MKKNFLLVLVSVLSIILMTIHLAGDIVFGMEKGGGLKLCYFAYSYFMAIWNLSTFRKALGIYNYAIGGIVGLINAGASHERKWN